MASELKWVKSSFSNGTGGSNCIEIARDGDTYLIRDSKNPDGLVHRFTKAEWDAFIAGVEAGEFRF